MKSIKIISPVKLDIYRLYYKNPVEIPVVTGCLGCLSKIGLLMFPFLVLVMGIVFLAIGDWWLSLISLIALTLGGVWMYSLFKGGTYKPEMSFAKWRASKEAMARQNKLYGTAIVIVGILTLFFVGFNLTVILGIVGTLVALYYMTISFKAHEDVDFCVNEAVAEMLGFEIDEKIQCSYEDKATNKMLIATDKKLFFAYTKDNKQLLLTKRIDELSEIGILTSKMLGSVLSTDVYLFLRFADSVQLQLRMDLGDSLTSNPALFFKKFLLVLDDYLLGRVGQRNASRRRVIVSDEANVGNQENTPVTEGRSIDISESISQTMKDAIPVTDNRNLEL